MQAIVFLLTAALCLTAAQEIQRFSTTGLLPPGCTRSWCDNFQTFCGTYGSSTPELHIVAVYRSDSSDKVVNVKFTRESNGIPVYLALATHDAVKFVVEVDPLSNVKIDRIYLASDSNETTVETQESAQSPEYIVSKMPYYKDVDDWYTGGRPFRDSLETITECRWSTYSSSSTCGDIVIGENFSNHAARSAGLSTAGILILAVCALYQ